MIVATAGHVDHGKTALVKALTGVDTDRLPEEKRRGMSIDLGFAYRPLAGGAVLGFVDVPGHERFLANMLAGLAAIDFALLVVAADDGPMPQTAEHLAILDLLGVRRGAVALSKIDRIDPARRAAAEAAIRALLGGTSLEGMPVFPVSALTGEGIEALERALGAAAREARGWRTEGRFRLAVDRCFTLPGAGLIVTGAAVSGRVAPGDELAVSPAGFGVRVRGLYAQNRPAETGEAGERLGLNLAGAELGKVPIRRGDWLLHPSLHNPTACFDVRLRILAREPRPLRHWAPVHIHLGAADVPGRVALIEGSAVPPGASARAQLVLDRPVSALFGDRFVLRDQSARRTIGGGCVIDPFAPRRGRARPERFARLSALERADAALALTALLPLAPEGIELARFALARNLADDALRQILRACDAVVAGKGTEARAFASNRWRALKDAFCASLERAHRDRPERAGENPGRLAETLPGRPGTAIMATLTAELSAEGRIEREGALVRLPGHCWALAEAEAALWRGIEAQLKAYALQPPATAELAKALGADAREVERCLGSAARRGLAVRIAANRFLLPDTVHRLAELAESVAATSSGGVFGAAAFRDRAKIGRNLAIDLLEFFDRSGFTERRGEARRVLRPAARVFGGAESRDPFGAGSLSPTIAGGRESSPVGRPDFKPGEGR